MSNNLLLFRLVVLIVLDELDSSQERAFANNHHDVDRIEIPGAGEAASKVCCRIGSGVKLSTNGTEEAQEALTKLGGDIEIMLNDIIDGDVVAQVP